MVDVDKHNEWLQLTVDIAPTQLPRWELALQTIGALSITYRDAEDNPVFEPEPGEITLWDSLKLTALFDQGTEGAQLIRDLSGLIDNVTSNDIQLETLPDRHWERAWLDDFGPMQFGRQLWICPLEIEPPQPQAVVLRLDPGLAFGTGTHPTTAMCLRWLDANELQNNTIIDYGCGSGVLGIAALLLGAKRVYATDIDPQAIQATTANAQVNNVENKLQCCSAEEIERVEVDVVMANILAGPLIKLAETLAKHCATRGRIVLSGLLCEQVDQVWRAYAPWFESRQLDTDAEWACLSATRRDR